MDEVKPLKLTEWHAAFEGDQHEKPHFVPHWLDAVPSVPPAALFGHDETRAQLRTMLETLTALLDEFIGFVPTDRPLRFAFKLRHTLVVAIVRNHLANVGVFQLLPPTSRPPGIEESVRVLHFGNTGTPSAPPDHVEMIVPSRRDDESASVHITHDIAKTLDLLVTTHQYDTEEIMQDVDTDVENALTATRAASYIFLRLLNDEPFDVLDLDRRALAARAQRILRPVRAALLTSAPGTTAVERARLARRLVREAGGAFSFDIVREVAGVFYARAIAHVRILPVSEWATSEARIIVPQDEHYTIELDDTDRDVKVIDFLRMFNDLLALFYAHIPATAYPFVIIVRARGEPRAANLAILDAEAKDGLLVVRADSVTFLQLGSYDGQLQMRRIILDVSRAGVERVVVSQLPNDALFGDLRGVDALRPRIEPAGSTIDQIRTIVSQPIETLAILRGAALAPLFSEAIEAQLTRAPAVVNDMLGLLVFAHAYAAAPADERGVLGRLYRNYTPQLREYVRELIGAVYGVRDLEQYEGSESSNEDDEDDEEDDVTLTGLRRGGTNVRQGGRRTIVVSYELAKSRAKRKKGESVDDDDDDAGGDNDDMSEDVAAREKRPRIDTPDASGRQVDDDELENIVLPPERAPDLSPTAYVTHDLVAKILFDFVARNRPGDVASLQSVERSFARVLQFVQPEVFKNLWEEKYPVLSAELRSPMEHLSFGRWIPRARRADALLALLYTRIAELDSQLDPLRSEAYDVAQAIERTAAMVTADTLAAATTRLTYLRSLIDELETQRRTARDLVVRYEGRETVSSVGQSAPAQRRVLAINRAWTQLFAIVDNLAHHPRVQDALLTSAWQPDAVVWLKTVEADRLNANIRRVALDLPFTPLVANENGGYQRTQTFRAKLPFRGRYYVAQPRGTPDRILNVVAGLNDGEPPANSTTLLLTTRRSETIFGQEWAFRREQAVLAVERNLERAKLLSAEYGRPGSVFPSGQPLPADAEGFTLFGAQFIESNRPAPKVQPRVVAARYMIGDVAIMSPQVNPNRMIPFWEHYADARRVVSIANAPPPPQTGLWDGIPLAPELQILAVDEALLNGLYALAARLPIFATPRDVQPFETHFQNQLRLVAHRNAERLVEFGEITDDEVAETADRFFIDEMLMRDALGEGAIVYDVVWRRTLFRELERGDLGDEIFTEINLLFVNMFGSEEAYAAETAETGRRFRKVEYAFLQFLFNAIVVKTVEYLRERNDMLETVRFNEGAAGTISRLLGGGLFIRQWYSQPLSDLADTVDFGMGDLLEEAYLADTTNAQRRQELIGKLRSIGIDDFVEPAAPPLQPW